MAQQYSWLGQRHKAAFQNLQISKILTRMFPIYIVYYKCTFNAIFLTKSLIYWN